MRELYGERDADRPRLLTDTLFEDRETVISAEGILQKAAAFAEKNQLLRADLWTRFVQQFREECADSDNGWRGEYWGKMMRGAVFTYSLTKNPALYETLSKTVRDILSTARPDGAIATYDEAHAFAGWDMWSRKYVLLGMQYFLEICREEELKQQIVASMCAQAGAIMAHVGAEPGKTDINETSHIWRGLNASSILEPFVRLYTITKEQRYLDFASYIVKAGGTSVENLITLAYQDGLAPYQYPVTKAYEMTSFFEGVLEYYRQSGEEWLKNAVIRYADRVLETDFTVIGGAGCTHELFDHSTVRQANDPHGVVAQETCVTVTLMKFFYQVLLLTGDARYADAIERAFYNAYLGAFNTELVTDVLCPLIQDDWIREPLPFDSYTPLIAGQRGNGIGGLRVMSDKHYYGCCACIGAAGIGVAARSLLLCRKDGFAFALYSPGSVSANAPSGQTVRFETETDYPRGGKITIRITAKRPEEMTLSFRIPAWSRENAVFVGGEPVTAVPGTFLSVRRTWKTGDTVTLSFDMRVRVERPIPYGHDVLMNKVMWQKNYVLPQYDEEDPAAKRRAAFLRGPLVLAQDARLGYAPEEPTAFLLPKDGILPDCHVFDAAKDGIAFDHLLSVDLPLKNGGHMRVIDCASAGKTLSPESRMAIWMLTDE